MLKIGVLVSGGGTNLQAIIDRIKEGKLTGVEIATVVSNRKNAHALARAEKEGIDAAWISPRQFESAEAFNQALARHFQDKGVDLVVMAGYLVVLGPAFVRAFEGRIINIHPSLIPSFCGEGYYGLKVHEAALARGVKVTGATVHLVDEGTDTGPILLQKAVEVLPQDTPETLQRRVMEEAEWVILPQAIQMIANRKG
ncbi:phosphoribosylglycinamide formyltransferase [Anaerotalea alkaliphila]|uniref:Phosphoribosylglycinamide formyltransferase n=1 Tax=Anaerotalea alkaliphila TaxID=2662126 RepID=A0A7X5HVB5_9FIRM|nr:phosphoribosylglycinamide formyltransferase [Anaerotalea alkaliphila]NDL67313.1 phosphoribosylglycinamide formyltransferase [Anaerotalea alkaliphila]